MCTSVCGARHLAFSPPRCAVWSVLLAHRGEEQTALGCILRTLKCDMQMSDAIDVHWRTPKVGICSRQAAPCHAERAVRTFAPADPVVIVFDRGPCCVCLACIEVEGLFARRCDGVHGVCSHRATAPQRPGVAIAMEGCRERYRPPSFRMTLAYIIHQFLCKRSLERSTLCAARFRTPHLGWKILTAAWCECCQVLILISRSCRSRR